jgi:hypothetical protein
MGRMGPDSCTRLLIVPRGTLRIGDLMLPNTLYRPENQTLECIHCLEVMAIRERTYINPEKLLELREEFALDHSECHKYRDQRRARQAREHRKERDRLRLLEIQRTRRVYYA